MEVIFRVDSSEDIGHGHVTRCLVLAEKLKKYKIKVKFICRDLPGNAISLIVKKFPVSVLPFENKAFSRLYDKTPWPVELQKKDVKETITILKQLNAIDVLIIDHYGVGKLWESESRYWVKKIMVIDSLMNRNHDCDVWLNQNFFEKNIDQYNKLFPKNCQLLFGVKYALLKDEFLLDRKHLVCRKKIKTILIMFGAANDRGATLLILRLLNELDFNVQCIVLIKSSNPNCEKVKVFIKNCNKENIKLYVDAKKISKMLLKADLTITAGGGTLFEMAALGRPNLFLSLTDNQKKHVIGWEDLGVAKYLGELKNVNKDVLLKNINNMDFNTRYFMSILGLRMIDGLGAQRVAEVIRDIK